VTGWLYQLLKVLGRIFGLWMVQVVAWIIACGYFMFAGARVRNSLTFYRALFPGQPGWRYYVHVFKQFQAFSSLYIDRLRFGSESGLHYATEGDEFLQALSRENTGCVFLMSHLGNWEAAARCSLAQGHRLMIYMGRRETEHIEHEQKQDLIHAGVKLVTVSDSESSPFDLIDGMGFIQDGGFVALPADRFWTSQQREVPATFLGHQVVLPAAPYALALATGVAVCAFFCIRTGPGTFKIMFTEPLTLHATTREERETMIQAGAAYYVRELERMLRRYPHQWGTFAPFLGEPVIRVDGTDSPTRG
jgi:predicted LPLAT superfamily acyltransferase